MFVVLALATMVFLSAVQPSSSESAPNKLLLILIDGFRWDYIDNFCSEELPGFTKLRQNGVAAEALIPVFPAVTVVNYFSILTGSFTLELLLGLYDIHLLLMVRNDSVYIIFEINRYTIYVGLTV